MSVEPKPSLLDYHGYEVGGQRVGYERWQQDTLVWCAEAMQDAAGRIERALAEERFDSMIQMPRRLSRREAARIKREWTQKRTVRVHSPWWRRWF